jgi:hypothetical protein
MPLRSKKPMRKDAARVTFFKGTAEEAKKVSKFSLARSIKEKGMDKKDATEIIQKVKETLGKMSPNEKEKILKVNTSKGTIVLKITRTQKGILIHQQPLTHGVTDLNSYSALVKILQSGFHPRVSTGLSAQRNDQNVSFGESRLRMSHWAKANIETGITQNDRYTIELMSPMEKQDFRAENENRGLVNHASTQQILGVNIQISSQNAEERKAKMDFYKKEIQQKFNLPVKFIEVRR